MARKKKKPKTTLATLDARDYFGVSNDYPEDANDNMGGGTD